MSFRLYPKFIQGNPRLRVFLPNFPMKMFKPKEPIPPNQVYFIIPLEMTSHDCKNYLQRIYNVPVAEIHTYILTGELKRNHKNYVVKDPDYRVARVTLPEGREFKFPDLFPKEKQEKKDKDYQKFIEQSKGLMKQRRKNWQRMDVPSWFEI